MEYLPPFVVYGTHQLTETAIAAYSADYRRALLALRDDDHAAQPEECCDEKAGQVVLPDRPFLLSQTRLVLDRYHLEWRSSSPEQKSATSN